MRLAIQFVVRQSGWLAFSFVLFALLNAAYVCEGLWQGSGLHGYIIERGGRGGPPHVVSVWAAFNQMLVFAGLAGVLLVFGRRGARHGLKPEAPKCPASKGRKK